MIQACSYSLSQALLKEYSIKFCENIHLEPENVALGDKTVYQNGSIDASFDPSLFALDSTLLVGG